MTVEYNFVSHEPRGAEFMRSTVMNAMQSLEGRINALIRAYDMLHQENQALREQQADLMTERATLIEKLELARVRVEAMVAQLKSMETGSVEIKP
uniref:Cell division protein ZapB n=2 Tax=Candidatus Kentrum sp. FM TaxID=2126340 RepID=A0A450SHQ6_9GAMM|nr:MAG: cell division protein ZapB [Candidatus Kentron sp. FM]VFK09654.1 MAG: cell division protein ZapB [Candidatus Kentron sp. FM]